MSKASVRNRRDLGKGSGEEEEGSRFLNSRVLSTAELMGDPAPVDPEENGGDWKVGELRCCFSPLMKVARG